MNESVYMRKQQKIRLIILGIIAALVGLFIFNLTTKKLPVYVSYISGSFIAILTALLVFLIIREGMARRVEFLERRVSLWNNISYRVNIAGETSFNNLQMGIILYSEKQKVEWANSYAKSIFKSQMIDRDIVNLSEQLSIAISNEESKFEITVYDEVYECTVMINERIVYFKSVTEQKNLETKFNDKMLAIGIFNLDNLEQSLAAMDAKDKSNHIAKIIAILTQWAKKYNLLFKGYSEERYLLITDKKTLKQIINDGFTVLEEIREHSSREGLRISLSIGFASSDKRADEIMDKATEELNMALSRGGNQAVVNLDGKTLYYGARIESFDTRSSVTVKHSAEEFSDIIGNASKCLVMGHRDMDTDAFGACVGVRKIVESLGKECKIIFSENLVDPTVKKLYQTIAREHSNFLSGLVEPSEATRKLDDKTLLIIVDVQYQNLLMDEKILKKAKHVAVIDHHRRNPDAIEGIDFLYIQPSASSATELITEMIPYLKSRVELTPVEATWMAMGVIVDTNNFVYRTSERTFEALSILQKYGANMTQAHEHLRDDYRVFELKTNALKNVEILEDKSAITVVSYDSPVEQSLLAIVADELMTIDEVKRAFAIGLVQDKVVGISARSLGSANVQIIMEHFAGGGHFTAAATKIRNKTVEEVKDELIMYLISIKNEGKDLMKIILQKDIKGRGLKNDVIQVPTGYGNYLIKQKMAIEATDDNLKQLQEHHDHLALEAEKILDEAIKTKDFINAHNITIPIKVGSNGKAFGSITAKQIVERMMEEYGIVLDKRKLVFSEAIDHLGTFNVKIQLHKEVVATLKVFVVEKE